MRRDIPSQFSKHDSRCAPALPEPEPSGRQQITDDLFAQLHQPAHPLSDAERSALLAEIVLINVPVASRIASRYGGRGCAREDLEQTAYLALVRAVRRFDPALGHHFLSYVAPCITGEIKRHFRDRGWMVRPPRPVQDLQPKIARELSQVDPATGLPVSEEDLATRLDVPVELVRQAWSARGCFSPTSLDRPLPDSEGLVIGDTLLESGAAQDYHAAEARAVLARVLSDLDPADRLLLRRRYHDEWTQEEIASELGITQTQVSRRLQRILGQLRESVGCEVPDGVTAA